MNPLGFIMAFVVTALIPVQARAATWYVDNAASGANKGISWTDAWTSFASIVWGAAGVKAGDTLYISGGSTSKTYAATLTIGASGTASSRITIAVDASHSAHSGIVIFDFNSLGDSAPAGTSAINANARNYVTISGNVNGASHIAINNLRNTSNGTATNGIAASGTTGVLVECVSSTNCNVPIKITSSTGFTIRSCQLTGVRGDAIIAAAGSSGGFDASLIYNNRFEQLFNTAQPPGATSLYDGPDGVQCGSGVSIFNNLFLVSKTTLYTSSQHPDSIQAQGNYLKIYGNEFRNVGDSSIDFDCFANPATHDVWIYNNLFDIVTAIDPYPEFFRLYTSSSSGITSINNYKILNNTFVNSGNWMAVFFKDFNGNPTSTGCEIKNNLFYNCGSSTTWPTLLIGVSSGFTASDWDTDANLWYSTEGTQYVSVDGTVLTTTAWTSANEPKGLAGQPAFLNLAAGDFHPAAASREIDRGVDLSNYFTTDRDGNSRAHGTAWDIGCYEYTSVVAPYNAQISVNTQ